MVVKNLGHLWDSSAREGLIIVLKCFFSNVLRGNDYGCYAPKLESLKRSICLIELGNCLMGVICPARRCFQ